MLLDLILEALGDTLDLILEAVGDMQDTWGSTLRFLTIFDGFGVPFGVQFEVNLMTFSSFGVATAQHWFQVRFLMFWEWNSGRASEE